MLLGTLWSSIKQIEAPDVFDWEKAIDLHAMQGNRASSRGEGKSHAISRVTAGTWGIFSRYGGMSIRNWCLLSEVRIPV